MRTVCHTGSAQIAGVGGKRQVGASAPEQQRCPSKEIEYIGKRCSNIGQRGRTEDLLHSLFVLRGYVLTLSEDWQGLGEACIPFNRKGHRMHQNPRQQSGKPDGNQQRERDRVM